MAQATFTAAPPTASQFPISFSQIASYWQPGVRTIEVDNGSALTLTILCDGQVVRTVGPYISRFNINTSGGWKNLEIRANNASIQSTDSLTVIAYDSIVIPPLLPAFGPSAWGGGSVPNSLTNVQAGDPFQFGQIQQIINLLTGVMTGQPVTLANILTLKGSSGSKTLQVAGSIFEVLNAAMSQIIFQIDDTGMASFPVGQLSLPQLLAVRNDGSYQVLIQRTSAPAHEYGLAIDGGTGALALDDVTNAARRVTVDPATGQVTVADRISSSNTGASGKPLLNPVPLDPPVLVTFAVSGGNTNRVPLSMGASIPSSAVAVALTAYLTAASGSGFHLGLGGSNSSVNPFPVHVSTFVLSNSSGAIVPVSSNSLYYVSDGSGLSNVATLNIVLTAFYEPS